MHTVSTDDCFSRTRVQNLLAAVQAQAHEQGDALAISIVDRNGTCAVYHRMDGVEGRAVNLAAFHAAQLSCRSGHVYSFGSLRFDVHYAVAACTVMKNHDIVGAVGIAASEAAIALKYQALVRALMA